DIKAAVPDYPYSSDCDAETVLAAYLKWGKDCVYHLKGMYAFAIYDRSDASLFLVRDRIGKKPLYYSINDKGIVFGSVLAPIMEMPGIEKTINRRVLSRYIYQQYICAPDTIFENVYELEPGSWLSFKEGKTTHEKYWDIAECYDKYSYSQVDDFDEAKFTLKNLITDSVKRRLMSDVPLGTFLSGGYDSSLVSAVAQSLSGDPIKTFCIGFEDKAHDESGYAEAVARHLGTDHETLIINEKMMLELVESIPKFFDEPFADSSQIPTMLVSSLARSKVTVALSGDGGDEFYCGYNVYDMVSRAQKLDSLGDLAYSLTNPLKLTKHLPFKVRVVAENRGSNTKTQLGAPGYFELAEDLVNRSYEGESLPVRYETEDRYVTDDWAVKRMLLDMDTYLPGDILTKVDRSSMKYSLECRCPLLDQDVMEYSFRIPQKFKYTESGDKKHILKEIAYDYIPRELLDRPKKGFGVPLNLWMRGPLKEELLSLSEPSFVRDQGLFNEDRVSSMVKKFMRSGDAGPGTGMNYSKFCWSYLVFQMWYRYYIG
nr:asparagine synthase (glutamine-hydrolyzing) [Lachnospiraceae bacterium]